MSQPRDNSKDGSKGRVATDRIVAMFEEGKRFTQDLLAENERLRGLAAQHKAVVKELTSQYVQIDVPYLKERIKLLEDQNRGLDAELREIKQQYATIERENWSFSERYLDVERQNGSLLNHYVATQRLLSAWTFDDVLAIIQEIIVNLIGSEEFEICLLDGDGRLEPIGGCGVERRGDVLPRHGRVAEAVASGRRWAQEGDTSRSGTSPVACVPLAIDQEVVGVICIHALLSHKARLEAVDHQLLDLLAEHAAVALFSSHQNSARVAAEGHGAWKRLAQEIIAKKQV